MFKLAPFVSVFFGLAAFATIPFGDTLQIMGREIQLQAVTLNVGILYVLGMISLGVYGLMMAGWASANNYALLGGQRAAALMISAEVAIGASIMGVVMVYGSLNMQDIARGQGLPLLPQFLGGWVPAWGILTQPAAFILFLTAGIASTKRIPFDTPEGESEIIGYFVEYSGMKFGMFAMADFLETVVIAGHDHRAVPGRLAGPLSAGLRLRVSLGRDGGAAAPRGGRDAGGRLLTKVVVMIWLLMLIRWDAAALSATTRRCGLGWLALFPLSVLNILVTGLVLLAVGKP